MVVMFSRQVPGGAVIMPMEEAAEILPVLRKFAEAMSENVTETARKR